MKREYCNGTTRVRRDLGVRIARLYQVLAINGLNELVWHCALVVPLLFVLLWVVVTKNNMGFSDPFVWSIVAAIVLFSYKGLRAFFEIRKLKNQRLDVFQ